MIINRQHIQDYLKEVMETEGIELLKSISFETLTDEFTDFLEVDVYDWLNDNYNAFVQDRDEDV